MLKSAKDIRIFGFILITIVAGLMVTSYLASEDRNTSDYFKVNAYFLNSTENRLVAEARQISKGSNQEMIAETLNILTKGSVNKMLSKTIPEFMVFQKGELVENKSLLQLEFTTDGQTMTGEEELFFKSSLVWTLTELPMITDLHVYVNDRELLRADGGPVGLMNRDNLVINEPLSPFVYEAYRVLLYFADEEYTGLLAEERVIPVAKSNPDQHIERSVVEQLIAGPSRPEHFATVPVETKIREVSTEGDICYVNLSNDALTKLQNVDARLTIYSIVNSLTELDNIKKVQFLVDSKKPELVRGGYDLSTPLERDESILLERKNPADAVE